MEHNVAKPSVRIWEETRDIPTYKTGEPDRNPMFLEKRVYQGSSGRVYPHPVIDRIADDKEPMPYRIVVLENEYVRIEIMPELGGRIYRALDRTNGYDFVYYNRVIKPALVGLAGPWISGGIEFNWPQHHRPNTYGPVETKLSEHEDGSATVWVSEIDRMYGTKMTAGFTLYPDRAYLEISARVYNRTSQAQTFLWWANPAVAVNDRTQSVFPPDVTAVFDHGKRDVSRFPIATGTYYKMDYSAGVDISRYKNIPVPTSYMAYKSDYDFVGGYDYGARAGLLHIADHHVSPGKKQWTWGNGEFGRAWDRNLTDEDGPYIELMTGVFTDNQPDFTWLQPYEEKAFKQYFMPYKEIGAVKNATIDAAVNLEIDEQTGRIETSVYATSRFEKAVIELRGLDRVYLRQTADLSPTDIHRASAQLEDGDLPHDLTLSMYDSSGRLLVAYRPAKPKIEPVPDAAEPLAAPSELRSTERLYLAGLHLEQYRHATFEAEDYYAEGLRRDPEDSRINTAYAALLLRRGLHREAERHYRAAIRALTWRNGNPVDGEAFYGLGLALQAQGRSQEAYASLYKSTWSAAWQDAGHFALAQIDCAAGRHAEALEHVERSLLRNARSLRARHLKAALLRRLGHLPEALLEARGTLELDPADFGAANECRLILTEQGERAAARQSAEELRRLTRGDAHNALNLAADYAEAGLWDEAVGAIKAIAGPAGAAEIASGELYPASLERDASVSVATEQTEPEPVSGSLAPAYPMLHYALGYLHEQAGRFDTAREHRRAARLSPPDYCFPNRPFELKVLEAAVSADPSDDKALYYLGCWLYDKRRYEDAIARWEASRAAREDFATVHRNLALAYYNKRGDSAAALESLERAFALDRDDARVFYERDQLYKKLGYAPDDRLAELQSYPHLVERRDDLYVEYVTLLNLAGRHEQAIRALEARKFHPWEGGEGKVTGQHVRAHVALGRQALSNGRYEEAIARLEAARAYPDNLGEGKLDGTQENEVLGLLAQAYRGLGDDEQAHLYLIAASQGLEEPAGAMYYNDQPPETIYYQGLAWRELGSEPEAKRRFHKLIDYAEKHLFDKVGFDYFAVSLPDFLVFEDDLNLRNALHCRYMLGLGMSGLGEREAAREQFEQVLRSEPAHAGARDALRQNELEMKETVPNRARPRGAEGGDEDAQ